MLSVIVLAMCTFYWFDIARSSATAGTVSGKQIIFKGRGKVLADGYYLRSEFVDQKTRTYSISSKWESPPIFSEFTVKRTTNGYQFEGGNLREGLVSFTIDNHGYVVSQPVDKPGTVENKPCFRKFCVSEIRILDAKSFLIMVNGKEQKFMSAAGFRRVEPDEK
jgi:hypothetical protein